MSKPTLKKIADDTFLDGTDVWENDARLHSEINGNIEQSDITQTHHCYDIGPIGPIWFAPRDEGVSYTSPRALLVFRAPRPFYVRSLQAYVASGSVTPNTAAPTALIDDSSNKIIVRTDRRPLDDEIDQPAGLPHSVSGATEATSGADPDWDPILSLTLESATDFQYKQATGPLTNNFGLVKKGDWFRILLTPYDLATAPRAALVVTVSVAEEHDE